MQWQAGKACWASTVGTSVQWVDSWLVACHSQVGLIERTQWSVLTHCVNGVGLTCPSLLAEVPASHLEPRQEEEKEKESVVCWYYASHNYVAWLWGLQARLGTQTLSFATSIIESRLREWNSVRWFRILLSKRRQQRDIRWETKGKQSTSAISDMESHQRCIPLPLSFQGKAYRELSGTPRKVLRMEFETKLAICCLLWNMKDLNEETTKVMSPDPFPSIW